MAVLVSAEMRCAEVCLMLGLDGCGKMLLVGLVGCAVVRLGDRRARLTPASCWITGRNAGQPRNVFPGMSQLTTFLLQLAVQLVLFTAPRSSFRLSCRGTVRLPLG
jgi:hypothetical protein